MRTGRMLMLAAILVAATCTQGAEPKKAGADGCGAGKPCATPGNCYPTKLSTQRYTYFNRLKPMVPWGKDSNGKLTGEKLRPDEMRITFLGSAIPFARRAQAEMSIFVEVGWDEAKNEPMDQFMFDLGAGTSGNYQAAKVGYARMDKIFINHLHADHVNDVVQAYGFGPSGDRKSPLFLWGNKPSGVPNPGNSPVVTNAAVPVNNYSETPAYYDDGIVAFCRNLREALRWHTESQAFLTTAYVSFPTLDQLAQNWGLPYVPSVAGDDPANDAFAMIPIELDWWKTGLTEDGRPTGDNIAYNNAATGAKVLHYPVIHCRAGSMGYKLEWTSPKSGRTLTMVYSSDTKPEWNSVHHAINKDEQGNPRGVDVFIHEMVPPAEIWAMKSMGLSTPGEGPLWERTVSAAKAVQNSSHTPQGAFGYMLSQINPRPRLAVATHFPVSDDLVACGMKSVQAHCPEIKRLGDRFVWSFDLMVVRVFPNRIEQRRAVVNDFSFNPPVPQLHQDLQAPKYHDANGQWDPYFQIDLTDGIQSTEGGGNNGQPTFREDGY